eukprot:TRINITY_DN6508_c0_g1_i1.p1 TRINITY_DN6508_c0_g1~~TRINITY_DN6508_c0_g1_i1.p1  ORF type:complete len:333 (-),score=70.49 TRINITY_DN6508_c0_g1_i1:38-997(-)
MEVILGTMTFGGSSTDEKTSFDLLNSYLNEFGQRNLDTAYLYAHDNGNNSETIIGRYLKTNPCDSVHIATKVNCDPKSGKSLSSKAIRSQFEKSLKDLQRESVDLLYLHWPDKKVPLEESLKTINELHQEKKFKEFGLSNFAAWQVVNVIRICQQKNYILPTVYQGMYNALTRSPEPELFPALREFGIKFYAYNPLAGGMLTGRYEKFEDKPTEGRFVDRPHYMQRFWKQNVFDAIQGIRDACQPFGISLTDASFRWMGFHSRMSYEKGDRIIIGASKLEHFVENVKCCKNAQPLPKEVVHAFENAWKLVKADSAIYFR